MRGFVLVLYTLGIGISGDLGNALIPFYSPSPFALPLLMRPNPSATIVASILSPVVASCDQVRPIPFSWQSEKLKSRRTFDNLLKP